MRTLAASKVGLDTELVEELASEKYDGPAVLLRWVKPVCCGDERDLRVEVDGDPTGLINGLRMPNLTRLVILSTSDRAAKSEVCSGFACNH